MVSDHEDSSTNPSYDDPLCETANFVSVNTTIGYAVADYQWGWNVIDWVDGWPTI